jgi:Flp pilus assembly pilin Flp
MSMIRTILGDERGVAASQYAVMAAVIGLAVLAASILAGDAVDTLYQAIGLKVAPALVSPS